ncbi:hypothetical protein niasHT_013807 [Heterodera trifolii]|uniref:Uncharacterized protein n=1 Tax=Heterodera trifolii TaxID=157864 RepID=A0ABD2KTX1_9BILA
MAANVTPCSIKSPCPLRLPNTCSSSSTATCMPGTFSWSSARSVKKFGNIYTKGNKSKSSQMGCASPSSTFPFRVWKKMVCLSTLILVSNETGPLEQKGVSDGCDCQYDVYHLMKAAVSDDWASFWPQTKVYLILRAKKHFNNRYLKAKRKEAIEKLFSNFEDNFGTIRDFIVHPEFLSVFADFTSE